MKKWKRHVKSRWESIVAPETQFPIVEILWVDATAKAVDWQEDVNNKTIKVTTVGYLVAKDDAAVTVLSLIAESQVGHGITIPMGCVAEIRFISPMPAIGAAHV